MNNKITLLGAYCRICIVCLVVFGLTGCLQVGKENLQRFVDQEKAKEPAPIPPIPEIRIHENFEYAAGDLRDPFKATIVALAMMPGELTEQSTTNGVSPEPNRLKEALEGYSLEDLRLVGILEKGRKSAVIRAPDGVVHLVNVGNHLGEDYGKIVSITDSELTLREIVPGEEFAFVERKNTLILGEGE